MTVVRHAIWLLCAVSVAASAQEDPLAWFPLRVGARWRYEYESKSGDRNRPDDDRWSSEETVTRLVTIAEGLVVLRDVQLEGNFTRERLSHIVAREREPYLVHGNCLYLIGQGWDQQNLSLRPNFRESLAGGTRAPDLCFPLEAGRRWGNGDLPWIVEPARAGVASFLPRQYASAIHIFSSHFGSGGQEDVWVHKGIGIVGERYMHNGTYDEYSRKLVSFTPGR